MSHTTKDSTGAIRSTIATGSETLSPLTNHLPSASIPLATDRRAGMAENALRGADEFVTTPRTPLDPPFPLLRNALTSDGSPFRRNECPYATRNRSAGGNVTS